MSRGVDHAAIKSGPTHTALLLSTAFVLDRWPLVAVVGAANLAGALHQRRSPFALLYRAVLLPLQVVRPALVDDDPAPHRFAQGVSGITTLLAAAVVAAGIPAGWALAWLVVVLAALNVTVAFCAGCFTYHQLARLGVVGSTAARGGQGVGR